MPSLRISILKCFSTFFLLPLRPRAFAVSSRFLTPGRRRPPRTVLNGPQRRFLTDRLKRAHDLTAYRFVNPAPPKEMHFFSPRVKWTDRQI